MPKKQGTEKQGTGATSSFCDASVTSERAQAMSHWVGKNLKFPPNDRLAESIKLHSDGQMGMHAVAACSYANGDLVLQEDALIRLPDAPPQQKQRLHNRYGSGAAFMFPSASVDWQLVDKDVREAVLSQFWCHPLLQASSVNLRDSYQACEDLLRNDPVLRRSWDASTLIRYLHIVDLNIHKDDEEKANAAFGGLFVLGSKFSHSCAPNCTWSFSKDGFLQYHAVRPIKPGDLFTFSYIGNGMNMMAGTVVRRRRLASLWFVCLCARCTEPDLCRQLPCPRCHAPKCVPDDQVKASDLEFSCEKPVTMLVPEVKTWRCLSCAATSNSSQMPVAAEERLSRWVPEVMQGSPQQAQEDMEKALELRQRAASEVSKGNWTWMLASFAWLQKCLIILSTQTIIKFSERDVREASVGIARWFEDFAPTLFEQRMSALSLTLKLMQNLGGALQDWGYNPEDPLGDGCPIQPLAERLGLSQALQDSAFVDA